MTTQFALFAPILRRLRFSKIWDSRSGGIRVAEWRRDEPDGRTLLCQIGDTGSHRLSHEWVGCGDTAPTYFNTESQLALAIQCETTRTDSRYRNPNNHHVLSAKNFLLERQSAVTGSKVS